LESVTSVDDRGRISIPASERKKRGIKPGDKFKIKGEGKDILLEGVLQEADTASRKRKWGSEAFVCAGDATFSD
jgi:AbrB family looped-hinge helix DNA binding protein